jgi:hypothetical protein
MGVCMSKFLLTVGRDSGERSLGRIILTEKREFLIEAARLLEAIQLAEGMASEEGCLLSSVERAGVH